jgi:hypothetical protein
MESDIWPPDIIKHWRRAGVRHGCPLRTIPGYACDFDGEDCEMAGISSSCYWGTRPGHNGPQAGSDS